MGMELEIAKILIPGALGFFVGRVQTSYTDKVNRTKDIQNELIKAIRSCTTSAIDYHSLTIAREQRAVKAFHLKQQLFRIRTDVYIVKDLCDRKDDLLQSNMLELLDAVTAYPFEASELPEKIDESRFVKISVSAEKLVEAITSCRPKLF